jgi:hypothetical protein
MLSFLCVLYTLNRVFCNGKYNDVYEQLCCDRFAAKLKDIGLGVATVENLAIRISIKTFFVLTNYPDFHITTASKADIFGELYSSLDKEAASIHT